MLKSLGKELLRKFGFEVRRIQTPGNTFRPIGSTQHILEDIRARGFRARSIIDCGASDGPWTRMARAVFPDASSVMAEPRPAMQEKLGRYCRETPGCTSVQAAVGASMGTAVLTDWDTGSTLLPVAPGDAPQISVDVVTLDHLAAKYGAPDIVKLDVEGFELEVLKGASALWGRTELFVIEVALFRFEERPIFHDVVAFMATHDYFVYDIGTLIRRPLDGALALVDVCFARGSGKLRESQAWR